MAQPFRLNATGPSHVWLHYKRGGQLGIRRYGYFKYYYFFTQDWPYTLENKLYNMHGGGVGVGGFPTKTVPAGNKPMPDPYSSLPIEINVYAWPSQVCMFMKERYEPLVQGFLKFT